MSKIERYVEATNNPYQYTAEMRRFDNFMEAVRRLGCDETGQLFRQAFQQVMSAKKT